MTVVALIFGGMSPEHEVSIVSARNVHRNLLDAGFDVLPVGIDRGGAWHVGAHAFSTLTEEAPAHAAAAGPLEQLAALRADVVFPLVHGVNGEDGMLAGLCAALGLPYVGGDMLNGSLCWDKLTARALLAQAGVPQLPYLALYRAGFEMEAAVAEITARFAFPVYVKPSRTGSSIGISRVFDAAALRTALTEAFTFDYRVIVEPGLQDALEIEIAGLGGLTPTLSVPARIIPETGFYDFEQKYLSDGTRFEVPAVLPDTQLAKLRAIALDAWRILNCYGLARIDFLVTAEEVYLNEINTYPGFTAISMYPRLMAEVGVDAVSLMRRLVDLALERAANLGVRADFHSRKDWWKQ